MLNERQTLRAMKNAFRETIKRCHNPAHLQYHLYGGRGITVCPEWRDSFDAFVADMGLRPKGLTLERVDNNAGYCKDNCRWATRFEQSQNTRIVVVIEWQGRSQNLRAWERELGFKPGTLKARIGQLGYSIEEAFTKPVKCGGKLQGRPYKPRRVPDPSVYPRGVHSKATQITPSAQRAYRERWMQGESFSALSREHGVSVTTMSNACQQIGAYTNYGEYK